MYNIKQVSFLSQNQNYLLIKFIFINIAMTFSNLLHTSLHNDSTA